MTTRLTALLLAPHWIASVCPGATTSQRAACWDGVFPIGRNGDMTPEDTAAMRGYIHTHRSANAPFDIVINGRARNRQRR
jgi:hypothetical protein